MFNLGTTVVRNVNRSGHWHTIGNFTYIKGSNPVMWWRSQREAARALGVSANVLSKVLSGKLPKLYR